jgi:hypothetical protein
VVRNLFFTQFAETDRNFSDWKKALDGLSQESAYLDYYFGEYKYLYGLSLMFIEAISEMVYSKR